MTIRKSGEDYLEAILMIQLKKGTCRAVDIARKLEVSKPSVSVAMGRLRDEGLVVLDDDGYLCLTEGGKRIADQIYERHCVLTAFFCHLGVDEETAKEDACRIEHDISPETFDCLKAFLAERKVI